MDASLARLWWALPVVLLIGVAAIWLLKRSLPSLARGGEARAALALEQSLSLSDRTTAHVLNVQGRRIVVIESPNAIGTIELETSQRRASGWPGRPWTTR